jgi:hypothetical protein
VPQDEIATAIARCAGCLADSVVTGESIDSGEGRAIHYGGSSKIYFSPVPSRDACARLGADVDRYSFTAVDFHHLLLAGFTGALNASSWPSQAALASLGAGAAG